MRKSGIFESEAITRILQAGGKVSEVDNTVSIPGDRIASLFAALRLETIHGFLRKQRKAGIRTVRYCANSQADHGDVRSNASWMVNWMIDDGQLREEDRASAITMFCEMIVDILPLVDARLNAVCGGGDSAHRVIAPRTEFEREVCASLYRAISYLQTFSTAELTDDGKQHIAQIYDLILKIPPALAGDKFHDAELEMSLARLEHLANFSRLDCMPLLVRPVKIWKENFYRWAGIGMVGVLIGFTVGWLI